MASLSSSLWKKGDCVMFFFVSPVPGPQEMLVDTIWKRRMGGREEKSWGGREMRGWMHGCMEGEPGGWMGGSRPGMTGNQGGWMRSIYR